MWDFQWQLATICELEAELDNLVWTFLQKQEDWWVESGSGSSNALIAPSSCKLCMAKFEVSSLIPVRWKQHPIRWITRLGRGTKLSLHPLLTTSSSQVSSVMVFKFAAYYIRSPPIGPGVSVMLNIGSVESRNMRQARSTGFGEKCGTFDESRATRPASGDTSYSATLWRAAGSRRLWPWEVKIYYLSRLEDDMSSIGRTSLNLVVWRSHLNLQHHADSRLLELSGWLPWWSLPFVSHLGSVEL